jgi:hypothetical protein
MCGRRLKGFGAGLSGDEKADVVGGCELVICYSRDILGDLHHRHVRGCGDSLAYQDRGQSYAVKVAHIALWVAAVTVARFRCRACEAPATQCRGSR